MKVKSHITGLWTGPDPVLAQAGVAGELLVAKIRLGLATLLLLIPAINSLFFFPVETREGLIGLSLAAGTFVLAVTMYLLISRSFNPLWLGFVSSSFDVTLITSALALFLLANQPHTAVNNKSCLKVIFWRSAVPAYATTKESVSRRGCWRSRSILRLCISRRGIGI
jgi:hypothetical protein